MKKRDILLAVLTAILMIGVLIGSKLVYNGFRLYLRSTEEVSVEQMIENVQNQNGYVKIENVSDEFLETLVKTEDHRFYYHSGVDIIALSRAVVVNVKEGYYAEGGSTITQQLAKNLFFGFEKKMERKVAELFVVFQLESYLSKDEILEMYINVINFGQNCFGIEEAAQHYYGISASELNQEQAEALVYTIKSPNNNNPFVLQTAN